MQSVEMYILGICEDRLLSVPNENSKIRIGSYAYLLISNMIIAYSCKNSKNMFEFYIFFSVGVTMMCDKQKKE